MDPAVALVQAFLQLQGYLTDSEFPIMSGAGRRTRAVTDIDLVAVRFPGVHPMVPLRKEASPPARALDLRDDAIDLLICEVKEGRARLNRNLARRETLVRALERIGCCPAGSAAHHADELLRRGEVTMVHGGGRCRARVVVFAGAGGRPPHVLVIPLLAVGRALVAILADHRDALAASRLSQPALAQMRLLEKLGVLEADLVPDGALPRRSDPSG